MNKEWIGPAQMFGLAVLGIYGWAGAFKPELFTFLNGTNILFHEAGHVVFSFFGKYLAIWEGTLLQLLIPLGIGIAFWVKREPVSAAVMGWWFGQNFFGISAYIKDARAQVLPFIGGEKHDWEYLLRKHGLLEQDQIVGNIAWFLGLFVMTAAIFSGFYALKKTNKGTL